MSKHFNLIEFFRKVPHGLLQTYCERQAILRDFAWGQGKHGSEEDLAKALKAEDRGSANRATIDFRTVWEMSGRSFTRAVLNEATFWNDDAAFAALNQQRSHLAKTFWTTLERPQYVKKAKTISDVDKLPNGAWVRRGGLPARPGPVDAAMVAALENSLVDFFAKTEFHGRQCKIDPIRRGGEEIFFAYTEDHPDSELLWQGDQLEAQVLNRPLRLIFKHDDSRRTLDIHLKGDHRKVPELQQLFASAVLGEDIPRDAPRDNLIYDIDRVIEQGFNFEYSPDLGIMDVRLVKVRFLLEGEPWRRFLIEADNTKERDALTSLVAEMTKDLPKDRLLLDQIHLKVSFEKQADEPRGRTRDCVITSPNVLRINKDDFGDRIETMLRLSGIEYSDDDKEP